MFLKSLTTILFLKNIQMNNSYFWACSSGELYNIQHIYHYITKNINIEELFVQVCENNFNDIAQWLFSLTHINQSYLQDAFYLVCEYGHNDIFDWLHKHITSITSLEKGLLISHKHKNQKITFTLCSICSNSEIEIKPSLQFIFFNHCKNGNFQKIKELVAKYKDLDYIQGFIYSYSNKHLEISHYLKQFCTQEQLLESANELSEQLPTLDQLIFMKRITDIPFKNWFRLACKSGDLCVVKYLLLSDTSISYGFKIACLNNQLEIAKYLYPFDETLITQSFFNKLCETDNLEIMKWMYSFGKVKIDKWQVGWCAANENNIEKLKWLSDNLENRNYFELFCNACRGGNLRNVRYINSIVKQDKPKWLFSEMCKHPYPKVAKWMYKKAKVISDCPNAVFISAWYRNRKKEYIDFNRWAVSKHMNHVSESYKPYVMEMKEEELKEYLDNLVPIHFELSESVLFDSYLLSKEIKEYTLHLS